LASHDYARYEISAYSKAGGEARHNINYWEFGDDLGIGAGAHGKITLADTGAIVRTRKTRMPAHYLDPGRGSTAETKTVGNDELALEFMLNALRLPGGVPAGYFAARTGLPQSSLQGAIAKLQQRGLLADDPGRLRPTPLGLQHLNELLLEFM
jgi:oxygen-independent coproporphyrinogen-3 oxidase